MEPADRRLVVTEPAHVPWEALVLGWGAMLPFAIGAAAAWLGGAEDAALARVLVRFWGAALLLFFSGVRRGLSFRTEGGPTLAQMLAFASLFCVGLAVLLLPLSPALGLLVLAFALLAVADTRAARRGETPLYFRRLRPWQMAFAVIAVASCWAAGGPQRFS